MARHRKVVILLVFEFRTFVSGRGTISVKNNHKGIRENPLQCTVVPCSLVTFCQWCYAHFYMGTKLLAVSSF